MKNSFSSKPQRTASILKLGAASGRTSYWRFIHLTEPVATEILPSREVDDDELDVDEKMRRLEAVLFLSPEGITSRKAAKLAGLADATEARTLIRHLNQKYLNSQRPYRIDEVAGSYVMLTRPGFAPWLRRLAHVPGEIRLTQSSLETLAVVAYRQPVQRANIEAIRGVGCSEVLKQLMELDLVRICGRSEDLGRPYLYETTRRFLQMFGLRSADRLPRIDWVNQFDFNSQSERIDAPSNENDVARSGSNRLGSKGVHGEEEFFNNSAFGEQP